MDVSPRFHLLNDSENMPSMTTRGPSSVTTEGLGLGRGRGLRGRLGGLGLRAVLRSDSGRRSSLEPPGIDMSPVVLVRGGGNRGVHGHRFVLWLYGLDMWLDEILGL